MENTANLSLPCIMPSQAQKHVTHNAALRLLDAIVQLAVLDRDLVSPPETPAEGDRYIVAASATGMWEGADGKIAAWQDGGWVFLDPKPGWLCVVADEAALVYWTSVAWESVGAALSAFQNLARLGVGTIADDENPFAAKLNKALWAALTTGEGGSGDLRYTLNKQGAGNVLSLLMQSNWSGRAEIGLVGNDDLTVKVSADGSNWTEALKVDRQSGKVALPCTNVLTDFAVGLLPDSGRFGGVASKGNSVGAFEWPSYLEFVSGTTAADVGKFIYDNTDYGGSAGVMQSEIKDLIDKIRDPAFRRYNPEFRVARVTMGAGTSAAISLGGVSYPLSLRLQLGPYPPCSTFHVYLRAETARIVLRRYAGQTIHKNGTPHGAHVPIDPADGWVSVTIHDARDPYSSFAHNPTPFTLQARSESDTYLIACAALMGGITAVDDNIGVVPSVNRWLP